MKRTVALAVPVRSNLASMKRSVEPRTANLILRPSANCTSPFQPQAREDLPAQGDDDLNTTNSGLPYELHPYRPVAASHRAGHESPAAFLPRASAMSAIRRLISIGANGVETPQRRRQKTQ
jgi:hypothetical protein